MAAEFVQRGRVCVEQGKLTEAVRICRLGLLANPGEIEGRLVLGSALTALARFDEVLAEMKSALDMEPSNPSALALKGEALLRKGDSPQSVAVLEQAARSAPGDPYVEQLLAEARHAAANGPPPSMTLDIDPELEGIELHEAPLAMSELPPPRHLPARQASDAHIPVMAEPTTGEIEELDADLLMEATPTPVPFDDDDDFAAERVRDEGAAMAALESFDEPFEAPRQSPYRSGGTKRSAPIPGRPATIGTLFPDDEDSGVELAEQAPTRNLPRFDEPYKGDGFGPGRSLSADMDLIRDGFGGVPAPVQPRPVSVANSAPREARREQAAPGPAKRRRAIPIWGWLAITLLFVAAGATGGLKIREMRLARQIGDARKEAGDLARTGTYAGSLSARDSYSRILKARRTDKNIAFLAMTEALLAAEFGASAEPATATMAKVRDQELAPAIAAAAYLALASGDSAGAIASAEKLSASEPENALGFYLMGRAQLLAGDAVLATTALNKALELGPTPLTYVALARAEALGGRYPEALAAIARATEASPDLPAALIWQARILLESGELPQSASDPDDKLAALIQKARERKGRDATLSPAQGAWAGLVLAEIKLQRGDREAAKKALAEAKVERPLDWMFSEMLSDVLIRLGDYAAAKEEATRALEAWPSRSKARVVLAQVALVEGDPDAAMVALEGVENLERSAEALTVRAGAELQLGKLEQAAGDLDLALSLRSRYSEALIARARVDIIRGDASAAIGRLEPVYDRTAGPGLAVAYAAALRSSGKSVEARKVLEPLVGSDGNAAALIELAELERAEGRYEEARVVFRKAIELDPHSVDAKLGAALLDIDDGQVQRGREALDALVEGGSERGQVLVEAARARTLTGDTEGATALLERTAENATWLGWKVARERGRIHLRRLSPIEAISELQRAQSLQPDDEETRILLMEAHYDVRDKRGSGRALQDITKMFRDSPVRSIAAGIHALLNDNAGEAIAAFSEARSLLIDQRASQLRLARVAYWLGRSYEFSGDLRAAEEWLDKATKLDLANAGAYFWLGQIHHMNQKQALMMAAYERAVEIDPGYFPLAWYFLGTNYLQAKQTDKAIGALEKFLKYYPDDSGDMVADAKTLLGQIR